MDTFLVKLLELSLQAGILTVAILLARFVFRKLPAKYLCLLWMIVAARLIIPVSVESGVAIMPSLKSLVSKYTVCDTDGATEGWETDNNEEINYYIGGNPVVSEDVVDYYLEISEGMVITEQPGADSNEETEYYMVSALPTPVPEERITGAVKTDWRELMASMLLVRFLLWMLGFVLLLGYGVFSCFKVKRLVENAIPYKDNILLCEGIKTPFLFGWRHPLIFLPTNLEEEQMRFVVEHEKSHIARGDQYTKLLGYVLLCIYWFNPLVWVAYVTFCKDVERACDERVIDGLSAEDRKAYAEVLLKCSVDSKVLISNPLAFGETDVKNRIVTILKYNRPGKWLAGFAVLLCVAAVAGCFFVQKEKSGEVHHPAVTPTFTLTPTPVEPTAAPTEQPVESTATPTPAEIVWSQTVTHIPSDLNQLESDLNLLGITTSESLTAVPVGQTILADLNGDGIEETITYGAEAKILPHLQIDDTIVTWGAEEFSYMESPCFTTYYIFDIDVTDGYKEIGLADYGPNGDVGISLYRYENGKLQGIGGFLGAPLESDQPWNMRDYEGLSYEELATMVDRENFLISVPGDGTVWAKDREYLLGNCGVVKKYQLENAGAGMEAQLKAARRGHYIFTGWDWEGGTDATAAFEFKAFASDSLNDETVVIVPEGSRVTFYEYYLSHEEWGRGYVHFFYSVEEKWDSQGWLIFGSDGIIMPRSSETEPFETIAPDDLFKNLNHAG